MTTIATLVALVIIEGIVIKVDDRVLCFLAAFALILYGFGVWATVSYLSILIVLAGIYNLARAIWAY